MNKVAAFHAYVRRATALGLCAPYTYSKLLSLRKTIKPYSGKTIKSRIEIDIVKEGDTVYLVSPHWDKVKRVCEARGWSDTDYVRAVLLHQATINPNSPWYIVYPAAIGALTSDENLIVAHHDPADGTIKLYSTTYFYQVRAIYDMADSDNRVYLEEHGEVITNSRAIQAFNNIIDSSCFWMLDYSNGSWTLQLHIDYQVSVNNGTHWTVEIAQFEERPTEEQLNAILTSFYETFEVRDEDEQGEGLDDFFVYMAESDPPFPEFHALLATLANESNIVGLPETVFYRATNIDQDLFDTLRER